MNMYNRNPQIYNAIQQNPYGAIHQNPYGNIDIANDKMAMYQYGIRILGTVVAYNRLNKDKDAKDADPAINLILALMLGGVFPIPYLAYVGYQTIKKK